MADDQAPSDYIAQLIAEGRAVEAILASHVERCFLYVCAISGDTHCKYCGRFITSTPPRGFTTAVAGERVREGDPVYLKDGKAMRARGGPDR